MSGTKDTQQDETETQSSTDEFGIGSNVKRREDRRMLTGKAQFTDDIWDPEMVYAGIIRSNKPHAKIKKIDISKAQAIDGVMAVLTYDDLIDDSVTNRIPPTYPTPGPESEPLPEKYWRRLLPKTKVRYQGEAIGVVIAENRYIAHDALDHVSVEYDDLECNVNPKAVLEGDTPTIHEGAPENVIFEWDSGEEQKVQEAFEEAAHTVEIDIGNQRILPNYIEPRAVIADYDGLSKKLKVQSSTQVPHDLRMFLTDILNHPENKIQVIAPDVGGGFGGKTFVYPEEPLMALCTKSLERPVKWQATRLESYLSDSDGRGLGTTGEMALDDDGNILAIRANCEYDMGAYVSGHAPWLAAWGSNLMVGQYDIPTMYYHVTGVFTNTKPLDAYRGVTETEIIQMLERLVNKAAKEVGMDPAKIRRQNMIQPDQFPYDAASGARYDCGNYPKAFNRTLEMADYEEYREQQEKLRDEGRYIGIGIGCFTEGTGAGPCEPWVHHNTWEYGNIQIHSSGKISVFVGTSNHGQAHETTFAQIVVDALGVDFDDVEVIEDDTDIVRDGVGTYASRSAAVAGGAITRSSDKIIEKAQKVAAHRMEVAEEDIEFEDGEFSVRGAPDLSMTLQRVAEIIHQGGDLPEDVEPGLEATTYFDPDQIVWTYGVHVPIVEVNPDTGEIEILEYAAVEDCGRIINPMVVDGQVHGGTAQGLGQGLYENIVYDANGNLITGSHMDYVIPKATQIPEMQIEHIETPTPYNPNGVKGTGESGSIVEPAAIISAVEDALEPFDIDDMTPPLTPDTIWQAIHEKGGD